MTMADTEEYFPRGGKKPAGVQYFKQSSNFLGTVEKAEKKKKRPTKKKSEADDGYLSDEIGSELDQSVKNCNIGIGYSTIKEGVLLLGRISRVQETKVSISLPGGVLGTAMACHISEPYNKLLEAYVNDQVESVRELCTMFHPGQYVAVKVLEVENKQVMLSMMPQHVNGGKILTEIHKGSLLQAAVSSVEDHGYVMDVGIPNTRAFLPKKNANAELELDTGILTWCCVKIVSPSSGDSILTLSNQLKALQESWTKRNPGRGVTALLPGTAVEFTVDKALENGIEGRIFNNITAYVQRQHADTIKGKKPTLGLRVRARLLYEMPTRKTPYLTMRSIFNSARADLQTEQEFKDGAIVEDAQVIKIAGRAVVFKLSKNSIGILSIRNLMVDEELTDRDVIEKQYPLGSEHKVRVISYHLSDYRYSVSDSPDKLSQKYFTLADLAVGDLVDAQVKEVADARIILQVGRMSGIVPHAHMTDSGIHVDPKKPSKHNLIKKKYKVGQRVSARVLSISRESSNLALTLKPSLLAPDLVVLKSYDEAVVGKSYTGVIKYIKPDYMIALFFDNVVAFLPKYYISREPIENLADVYHVGQIVNVTIINVDSNAKKMTGSFTHAPFTPNKKGEKRVKGNETDQSEKPMKKRRSDSETETVETKTDKVKERKKKKDKHNEEEDKVVNEVKDKKKEKNKAEEVNDEADVKPRKKKDKSAHQTPEINESENETNALKNKKNKSKKQDMPSDEINPEIVNESESDAIETDFYSDTDPVLTPDEMLLVDLTDLTTAKQFKKRIMSLLRNIRARARRIEVIDDKIQNIESMGLDRKNKKYHTAMQTDRLLVEERIKILMRTMRKAQEKLKEFPEEPPKEFKKKKDIKLEMVKEIEKAKELEAQKVEKAKDKKKEPKNKQDNSKTEEKVKIEDIIKSKVKEIKVADKKSASLEVPSVKDFWSTGLEITKPAQNDEESSSSDEEEQEQPKKKRKKLSAADKVAKAREEEERLRELERAAVESSSRPQSSEQFERALLASPDCSQLWIAYMAFHLQATEIEKARAVGRKALNTISFREEQEKLNVWLAMLNFEHRFGTKESQQKTLEEALQMNDPYKVHSQLLETLSELNRPSELCALVELMVRRYKRLPQAYVSCGAACLKLGLLDKARQVMQKAISVLDKKEHVFVLVQFALMERSHGDRERAEALFEQILGVYPGRVDVCSTYVDMLYKAGDVALVRQVMERMTSQKLPARKMKILYKKWIEIEEKIGNEQEIERIRAKALEFIENAKF